MTFPVILENGTFDGGTDDGVEAGRVATARTDTGAVNFWHGIEPMRRKNPV